MDLKARGIGREGYFGNVIPQSHCGGKKVMSVGGSAGFRDLKLLSVPSGRSGGWRIVEGVY